MATLLDIKNDVAGQLGATDGAVSVPKRDRAINRARRKFYSERKWSFCFRSATSQTVTSQLVDLPTNFNKKFDPDCVYYYSGGVKYEFEKVEWSDIDQYDTGSYVYAINKQTEKIKINQTTVSTIDIDYYQLPTDAAISTTDDSTEELAPDIEPITTLSIAYWWLTAQRSTANFDRFMDIYRESLLPQAVQADVANHPPKPLTTLRNRLGYNRRYGTGLIKGYISRG